MTKDVVELLNNSTVAIGNRCVTIKVKKSILDDSLIGQSRIDEDLILISKKQSDSSAKEILLHEILHIIYSQQGMEMGVQCEEREEYIVSVMAHNIRQVLMNNKWLGEFLCQP